MMVAYVSTACHCDLEGREAFVRTATGLRRPLKGDEPWCFYVTCNTCGGCHTMEVSVLLDSRSNGCDAEDCRAVLLDLLEEVEDGTERGVMQELMMRFRNGHAQFEQQLLLAALLLDQEEDTWMRERFSRCTIPLALLVEREELGMQVRGLNRMLDAEISANAAA